MKRPVLSEKLSPEEFKNWYWYRKELANFCKKIDIPANGTKPVLEEKIVSFLKTGNYEPVYSANIKKRLKKSRREPPPETIRLSDAIPENYKNSQKHREFFTSVIGKHFHFTAYMMNYIKNNPGMTYQDYVNEWNAEYERRKDKNYKPPILKSCEYNQYIRDFFAANKGMSLNDAIRCWKYKKSRAGDNVYQASDLAVLKK